MNGNEGTRTRRETWSFDCTVPMFVQLTVLGSPYGLDASCIRCTCFRNSDGTGPRAVHLFDEPHGDRLDLASPSHRKAECRHPYAGDQVRRLSFQRFLFRNPIPASSFFLLTFGSHCA